jgi:hypothetical protein
VLWHSHTTLSWLGQRTLFISFYIVIVIVIVIVIGPRAVKMLLALPFVHFRIYYNALPAGCFNVYR